MHVVTYLYIYIYIYIYIHNMYIYIYIYIYIYCIGSWPSRMSPDFVGIHCPLYCAPLASTWGEDVQVI